jgi:Lar family restriction alleviation protein
MRTCPFCGGTAILGEAGIAQGGVAVHCTGCGSVGPRHWTAQEAIDAWDKRPELDSCQADLNGLLDALNSDTVDGALEWADQLWVWVDEWNKIGQPKPSAHQSRDKYGRVYTWTLLPKKP